MEKYEEVTVSVSVLSPTVPKAKALTKDDVWGKYDKDDKKIHAGMIVARSKEICPHFGDKVPYKSVTVICLKEQEQEVVYWLEYVHGGGCINVTDDFTKDDKAMCAIRSDYQCW